jgi:Cys-rich repeat protein
MRLARVALITALLVRPALLAAGIGPAPIVIECSDSVGIPGGIALVTVTLAGDTQVVGTQNDLVYDDAVLSISRGECTINPDIGPGTGVNKDLQDNVLTDPPRLRGIVVSISNVNPIPSGALYSCPFHVAADAALGSYDIGNTNVIASDADGQRLPVTGGGCHVVVALPTATPTATPGCRDNSDCPSGEVCVDGHCLTATPTTTPTPPGFCNDDHDCPAGQVCVDHHCVTPTATPTPPGFCNEDHDCPAGQVCVDHHCVTPTPTPQCHDSSDCPSGEVCVDGMCVTATPTATPTKHKSGGGGGCSCEIDPGTPRSRMGDGLAVLLPALVVLLRWRSRRAARVTRAGTAPR